MSPHSDLYLTLGGFVFHGWPGSGEARWQRDGVVYHESEARAVLAAERIEEDKTRGRRE